MATVAIIVNTPAPATPTTSQVVLLADMAPSEAAVSLSALSMPVNGGEGTAARTVGGLISGADGGYVA